MVKGVSSDWEGTGEAIKKITLNAKDKTLPKSLRPKIKRRRKPQIRKGKLEPSSFFVVFPAPGTSAKLPNLRKKTKGKGQATMILADQHWRPYQTRKLEIFHDNRERGKGGHVDPKRQSRVGKEMANPTP